MDFGIGASAAKAKKYVTFKSMGLPSELLRNIPHEIATPIQRKVIPLVKERADVVGISRTGSGKTFAYLLPIIAELIEQQKAGAEEKGVFAHAHCIVIVPTHELAAQVQHVFAALADKTGLNAAVFTGAATLSHSFNYLVVGRFEVVICTPGRLEHMLREVESCKDARPLHLRMGEPGKKHKRELCAANQDLLAKLTNPALVVIDEMDRIFEDENLAGSVECILSKLRTAPRYAMFSATNHKKILRIQELLGGRHFEMVEIAGGLCDLLEGGRLQMNFFLVNEQGKMGALLGLVRTLREKERAEGAAKFKESRALIFASTCKRCEFIAHVLEKAGLRAGILSSEESDESREHVLQLFRKGELSHLVCTDLGCRGLDIRGVKYVVDFDFASSRNTEIHRVGRMNREKGEAGTVFSFIRPADLVVYLSLVNSIYSEKPRDATRASALCFGSAGPCAAAAGSDAHRDCVYLGLGKIPPSFYYEHSEAIGSMGTDSSLEQSYRNSYERYNKTLPAPEKVDRAWAIRDVKSSDVKMHPFFRPGRAIGGCGHTSKGKEEVWEQIHKYKARGRADGAGLGGRRSRRAPRCLGLGGKSITLAQAEKYKDGNYIQHENKKSSLFEGFSNDTWKAGLGLEGGRRKELVKEEGNLFAEWKKENRERLSKGVLGKNWAQRDEPGDGYGGGAAPASARVGATRSTVDVLELRKKRGLAAAQRKKNPAARSRRPEPHRHRE